MLEISFLPFPVLTSDRLILRRIEMSDAAQVFKLRSDAQVMRYVPRPLAVTIEDAIKHIELIEGKLENAEGINWAITIKGNLDFIGIIGLFELKKEDYRAEIGYMLLPDFHRQGITTEAIAMVLDYGFGQMNLHSVEAIIAPQNTASEKVLQKNGFVKEAHFRENFFYNGEFLDTVIYSILTPVK